MDSKASILVLFEGTIPAFAWTDGGKSALSRLPVSLPSFELRVSRVLTITLQCMVNIGLFLT